MAEDLLLLLLTQSQTGATVTAHRCRSRRQ
jgi:hypothetical protein